MKLYGIIIFIALSLAVFTFTTGMIMITGNHIQLPDWVGLLVLVTGIISFILLTQTEKIVKRFSIRVKGN